MGNTRTAPTAAEAAPAQDAPTVTVAEPTITKEQYDQLVHENKELKDNLTLTQKDLVTKTETVDKLTSMLSKAAKGTSKVVVPQGPVVTYKDEVYASSQAAYWFPSVTKPVHHTNLSEEQILQLISEEKLVKLEAN